MAWNPRHARLPQDRLSSVQASEEALRLGVTGVCRQSDPVYRVLASAGIVNCEL